MCPGSQTLPPVAGGKPELRGWWRNNQGGKATPWAGVRWGGGEGREVEGTLLPSRRAAAGLAGWGGVGGGKNEKQKPQECLLFLLSVSRAPGYFPGGNRSCSPCPAAPNWQLPAGLHPASSPIRRQVPHFLRAEAPLCLPWGTFALKKVLASFKSAGASPRGCARGPRPQKYSQARFFPLQGLISV